MRIKKNLQLFVQVIVNNRSRVSRAHEECLLNRDDSKVWQTGILCYDWLIYIKCGLTSLMPPVNEIPYGVARFPRLYRETISAKANLFE